MGLFEKLFDNKSNGSTLKTGLIDYGRQKKDGSHDHRYNTGTDRTPSQRKADKQKGS